MKKAIVILSALAAVLALFLPETILLMQSKTGQDEVKTVAESEYRANYYSLAKKASDGLVRGQKVRLANGSWESEISEIDETEMKINSMEAVKKARIYLQNCYEEGVVSINVGRGTQWYYPVVKAYKAEDTTFHTYAVKFYEIHFEKYNGEYSFDVKMLEDGYIYYNSLS